MIKFKRSVQASPSSGVRRCWVASVAALALLFATNAVSAEADAYPALPDRLGVNISTGDDIELSALKGRVIVLSFWATWCKPCMLEMNALERMQAQIPKTELIVLAVNYDEPRMHVKRFVRKHSQSQLTMVYDRDRRAAHAFEVKSLPQMVLIDHTGAVRAHHKGYSTDAILELVDEINGLLDERDQALRPAASTPSTSAADTSPET